MPFSRSDGGGSAPRASDSSGGPRGQVDFSPRRGGYFAIEVYFTVSYLISSSSSRLPDESERSSPSFQRIGWTSIRSARSEEHTSELQSQFHLVCRLLLEKKKR